MNDASLAELQSSLASESPQSAILINVDWPLPEDGFAPGATISGNGWILAESDVVEVAIYISDHFVCFATYGEPRLGVADRFPHFAHADSSGFSFSFRLALDVEVGSMAWIFVQVSTADGCVKKTGVPIKVVSSADFTKLNLRNAGLVGAVPAKISVERAVIDGSGLLRVSGWALSIAPLLSLELFLGNEALGLPELGLSRPDVAAIHPEFHNSAASGFRLIQDVSEFTAEHPVLRVRATAVGGLKRQVIVPIAFPHERRSVTLDDAAISVCVDSFAVRSDGSISASGWAVAAAGIQTVNVELDGQTLGNAEFGGDRPDVGNRFPRIPGARRSGFSLSRSLNTFLQGEHLLAVQVHDVTGAHRILQIPLLVEDVTRPAEIGDHLTVDEEIRFDIDAPVINGDRARDAIRGVLTISGWALALDGIAKVEVFLEDQSLGLAYYGMRREDIAAAFPYIEGALLSGFALTVPHRMLGEGDRNFRLVFKSKAGKLAERTFIATVTESEETIASTLLRDRIGHAELDLGLAMARRCLILVIVRPMGSDEAATSLLRRTLKSLVEQASPYWQVAVVVGSGEDAFKIENFITEAGLAHDVRIRIVDKDQDPIHELQDLAGAGAKAYVASLRAGDMLGADALLVLASELMASTEADFWYTDDRRVDPSSGLVTAFFKPDWSPELSFSTNYIGRAWFASAKLLSEAGVGFGDLAHAPDYDVVLRLTETARRIGHIPRVLLDAGAARGDAAYLEERALREALLRREGEGEVLTGRAPSTWRIKRRLKTTSKVSFVIPTCAARGLIKVCVNSIRTLTKYTNYELIVIDNIPENLPDERKWVIDNCDKVLNIPDKFNWSRFNNIGASKADGEFLLFLNDDIQVLDGDWLGTMLEEAEREGIGVVGPQLLYPDHKVQHAGIFLTGAHGRHAFRFSQNDDPGYFGLALTPRNMLAVTGACMLSRRTAYDRAGGFDEAHSVVNNDVDYCMRIWRAGMRVLYTPFASLIHHELASRAAISDVYDEARFVGEWSGVFLKGDPYFNPNLSIEADEYAIDTEPAEVVHAAHPLVRATGVKNILALKLDHIGDFITAMPAFRRLKQRFPQAKLCALASKASRALAVMEPAIDEVIEFDFFHVRSGQGQREVSKEELEALQERLAPHTFDLAIDLRMQPDTRHVLQYTGARLLAGFEHTGRFPWLDVALEWEGDTRFAAKRTHVVDRLSQLVEALALACDTDRSGIAPMDPAETWQQVLAIPAIVHLPVGFLDKPLVCVHPAVGSDTRQWPEEHFAGLIDLLVAEQGVHVALIGGKDEIPVAEKVLDSIQQKSAVVSLLGSLSLRELPMVLRVAALYVGNNSGPKHLAAALGTPTVGVHSGVVDATEWGPFGPRAVAIRRKTVCSPCYIAAASDCHRNLACLRKLRPSDVYDVCRAMLVLGRQLGTGPPQWET